LQQAVLFAFMTINKIRLKNNKLNILLEFSVFKKFLGRDLQLPTCMQSVPITTNAGSFNPTQMRCTRYNIT